MNNKHTQRHTHTFLWQALIISTSVESSWHQALFHLIETFPLPSLLQLCAVIEVIVWWRDQMLIWGVKMVQVAMGWLKLCTTLFLFRNTLNIDKQLKLIRLTVITFYSSLLHLTFSLKYSYTLKYSHLIHVHSVNMCSQGGFSSVIN